MRKLMLLLALLGFGWPAMAAIESDENDESPTRARKTVIAFYGDSTIRGYQTHSGNQVKMSTPQAFAAFLAAPSRFTVLNEGADSSRVEHLLAGTDGRHPRWEEYLRRAKVDIIITNHASKNGNPVSQYEADMKRMLRMAREHGKFVIFMTPNPIAEDGLQAYVDAMRRLAAQDDVPLIDVYQYLNDYMAATGKSIADIVPDGYHPADDIYVLIGRYAAREFNKMKLAECRPPNKGRS